MRKTPTQARMMLRMAGGTSARQCERTRGYRGNELISKESKGSGLASQSHARAVITDVSSEPRKVRRLRVWVKLRLRSPRAIVRFLVCVTASKERATMRHHLLDRRSWSIALVWLALLALASSTDAKVIRIVIDKSKGESPAYGGNSFGKVGQYEKIVGRAYGELDPKDNHNAIIQDIQL